MTHISRFSLRGGAVLVMLVALVGCGVDGAPVAPKAGAAPQPGVSVGGDARVGVVHKS